MKRTDIINSLIKKNNYKSYLEIGVHRPHMNFNHIDIPLKWGVDPDPEAGCVFTMTSDEFFAKDHGVTFDIIFIDGLHHSEQVFKDLNNAIGILEEGGTIVVHDCSPTNEDMQMVPQEGRSIWTGDVWKAWVKLRSERSDVKMAVVDTDWGCGIITHGEQEVIALPETLTYEVLDSTRKELLNLISVEEFQKSYL